MKLSLKIITMNVFCGDQFQFMILTIDLNFHPTVATFHVKLPPNDSYMSGETLTKYIN